MGQEKPLTPERQLLNLIEGGAAGHGSLKAEEIKHRGLSLLSAQAWLGRISFLRRESVKWFQGGGLRRFEIKDINKVLSFFAVILLVYFMVNLYILAVNFGKMPGLNIKIKQPQKTIPSIQAPTVLRALTYYLEKIRARDIFIMGKVSQPEAETGVPKPSPSRVAEVTQSLRLAGISWSTDPDAMLEDTKAQKTYFVKKGQILDTINVKVEAIFKDKVILSFEGAEIELK